MSWQRLVGSLAASTVEFARATSRHELRLLRASERAFLEPIFRGSVDLSLVRLLEGVTGLVNTTRRVFVIRNAIHLPRGALPVTPSLLVHELVHVWQFQNGGHGYITNSVRAQWFGDGYDLAKGLREGKAWHELNAEQQATLIEHGFSTGAFDGAPFVVDGHDYGHAFAAAVEALRSGQGADFLKS